MSKVSSLKTPRAIKAKAAIRRKILSAKRNLSLKSIPCLTNNSKNMPMEPAGKIRFCKPHKHIFIS
ncbi:MAG: hypothetical protein J6X11_01110 [Treponema sp.]|nr:hypothetical protein [Treponema sp.]